MPEHEAGMKSTERCAIECGILKVYGSECLDYVVDEAVQIFGGMGYSAEGPVERAYRDASINRIFEGTNEINRLLTVDLLLKRAMKGQPDLMTAAWEVPRHLPSHPVPSYSQNNASQTNALRESNSAEHTLELQL